MGDPSDFTMGRGWATIPKEVYDSLESMANIIEQILTYDGKDMPRATLRTREKELTKARRMLDKYRTRQDKRTSNNRKRTE